MRGLESLLEAAKKPVIIGAITFSSLFSIQEAKAQSHEICQNEKGINQPRISYDGDFYYINYIVQTRSGGFYIQDDLVTGSSGDCLEVNLRNGARSSYNGEPAFVTKNYLRSRERPVSNSNSGNLQRNSMLRNSVENLAGSLISAGIVALAKEVFSSGKGNSRSSNAGGNERPRSQQENNNKNKQDNYDHVFDPPEEISGKDRSGGLDAYNMSEKNKDSSSLSSKEGNIRGVDGRKNPPAQNNDVSYNMGPDNRNPGENYPRILTEEEKKAKEFFGDVRVKAPNQTLYQIGNKSRLASYKALDYIPFVGDLKDLREDAIGPGNPVNNVYNNKLNEAEDYFESNGYDIGIGPEIAEDRSNFSKVVTYELLGEPKGPQ